MVVNTIIMKYIVILFFLAALILPSTAQKVHEPDILRAEIRKTGDSLRVDLRVGIHKKLNGRNYKQIFTPVLYRDSIENKFPEIIVGTRRSQILNARQEISYGKKNSAEEELHYEAGRDTLIVCTYTIPYQDWMAHSFLRLDRKSSGCCKDSVLTPMQVAVFRLQDTTRKPVIPPAPQLADLPRMVKDIPADPLVKPVTQKWIFTNKDMIVDFNVNASAIDLALFGNRQTLDDITEAVRKIGDIPGARLNKIEITGYASPEGTTANNTKLAGERAQALKNYILQEIPYLKNNDFALKNGGENWEGLRKMVAESDMPYKNKVLYIIDNVPAEINYTKNTSRKKQLMDLANGEPYRYMSRTFFEKLRNACYISIYYDSSNDTAADIINHAVMRTREGNFEKALERLQSVKDDARAWNCMGVCYLFTGNEEKASEYLQKAAANGDKLAKENLLLLSDKK